MAAIATRMTPEEFLLSPEAETCELIDGVPREIEMGSLTAWLGGKIYKALDDAASNEGLTFPADAGFRIWPGEPTVRRPDVAFVPFTRLGSPRPPEGWLGAVPSLVVEVVSLNDRGREIERKVEAFLAAGVDLVWIVYPDTRVTYVHQRGNPSVLRVPAEELLDGSPAVPGFTLRLADILDLLPAATAD